MEDKESELRRLLAYSELDRQIWEEELAEFVPARMFDAHVHLFCITAAGISERGDEWCRHDTTLADIRRIHRLLFLGRQVGCLAFGLPYLRADDHSLNRWVAQELEGCADARAALLVRPEMSVDDVAQAIRESGFVALKPYHHNTLAERRDIRGYFPEAQMEVADELRLPVILHCRHGVLADLPELEHCAKKYPGIRWVLAHCGAEFLPHRLEKALPRLQEIPNLWYDNALICETDTLGLILKYAPPDRVMFGTDSALIIGGCRKGRVMSYGRSVMWWKSGEATTFWVYEQLRSMKRCCQFFELSAGDVTGLFYANAEALYLGGECFATPAAGMVAAGK